MALRPVKLNAKCDCKTALKLPPLEEQKAIAAVLNNQDQEIRLLRQKLDALRRQKKGLMQQLLTGKVRVNVTGAWGSSHD